MQVMLRKLGYVIVPLLAVVLLALVAGNSSVQGAPTLTTDKPDYLSGEIAHISGGGYAPSQYALPVLRPDGSIVKGDGSFTLGWDIVTADAEGNLAYDYRLDGIFGGYEARVYPADWSGDWGQAPIASTTFTDANANLDQCTNGGVADPPEPCKGTNGSAIDGFKNWVSGNSNGSKSHWREGEFISYRDTIAVGVAGTHVFQIHYDTVVSSEHAIDYLGSFDYTETTSTTPTTFHANNNNPCADKLPSGDCDPSSPTDPDAIVPPATLINCGGSAGTPPSMQIEGYFQIWGTNSPDITGVSYVAENVQSGQDHCSTSIAITFTTTGAGTVVLAWGGHIAAEADWGAGNSATFINGSPYHMAQDSLKSNGINQSGVGSQDRQLATSAVFFTPTIATVIYDDSSDTPVPGDPPAVTVGTAVYDTATLSGASSNAGGTVTYNRFNNGTCSGTPANTETVAVTNAVVPDSSPFTPTAAGSYSYQAVYGGDLTNFPATSPCEPLTVTSVTPTLTTTASGPVTVGQDIHDVAHLGGGYGTLGGSITFDVFAPGDTTCKTPIAVPPTKAVSGTGDYTSGDYTTTAVGIYRWIAHYSGDANNNAVDTACNDANESSTVNKATPTLTTTVKDKDGNTVDNTRPAAQTTTVHDTATLSGQVNGFSFDGTASVTYSFFKNNGCSGDPFSTEDKTVAVDGTVPDSSAQTLGPGSYSYKAHYSGNAYYNPKDSDCEPFKVVQKSLITDTSLCTFDIDPNTTGSQFRLIFTPDTNSPATWKLNASNPGQFYYNVFDNAPTDTINFMLPYPFVTQGAVPIHVYSSVTIATVNGQTCLIPVTEIAHSSAQVTLASYSDTNGDGSVGFGDTATVSVTFSSPSGFAYANIHVDYGLKGTINYSKDAHNNAIDATTLASRIPDNQSYTFSENDGAPDSQSVSSRNSFKRDPGIAGLVRRSGTDAPVPNAQVVILGDGKKQTVSTDEDGWYMWQYKYTGKPAAFTVKLLAPYNLSQTVTLKSNGFVVVSFTVS